jgi:hypothetical protein
MAAVGLLLQYLPARAAMLILAGMLAAGVLYGATRRELRRALAAMRGTGLASSGRLSLASAA